MVWLIRSFRICSLRTSTLASMLLSSLWCGFGMSLPGLALRGMRSEREALGAVFRGAMLASRSGYVDRLGVRDPGIPGDPDLQHSVAHPGFETVRVRAERKGQQAPKLSV